MKFLSVVFNSYEATKPPDTVKEMLMKESKDKGIKLPDFKMYYKTEAIKITRY